MAVETGPGETHELRRALGPINLTAIGIGAIIGAGIFVLTGHAAAEYAGPGIVISFIVAGLGCLFAGLCYSEFASMIPASGSAYTYAYATMGKLAGWIIGWDLMLEYLAGGATVAVGWSGYFNTLLAQFGMELPAALTAAPFTTNEAGHFISTGAIVNLPAVGLVVAMSALLVIGIRSSAGFNNLMVLIKLAIVLMVIGFGLPLVTQANLTPFIPPNDGTFGHYGWSGILRAAAVIFFAYIGFDTVSVAAQEAKNPQRDLPIGILGSLLLCTVLYILMSLTMTGLVPYKELNVPHPAAFAVETAGLKWLVTPVSAGAVVGLATVVLVLLYGQSRIVYAMARDGLLPKMFAHVHPTFRTPWLNSIVTCVVAGLAAGFLPLGILGELVSIGTLAAFVIVCVGIIVLRRTKPNAKRPFRTPWVPVIPILGILFCGGMMAALPGDTWIRLAVWFAIGLAIYFLYSVKHAKTPEWKVE